MLPVVSTGRSCPLGATVAHGGVNFSLYSRSASGVELLFFDQSGDKAPSRVIPFDSVRNRTYHYWHMFVSGIHPGQLYGYRVAGPSSPASGLRFDPEKALLDPYGRAVVVPQNYDRLAAARAPVATPRRSARTTGSTRRRSSARTGSAPTTRSMAPIPTRWSTIS